MITLFLFTFQITSRACTSSLCAVTCLTESKMAAHLHVDKDVMGKPCKYRDIHTSGVCQMSLQMDQQPPAVEETHIPRHLEQMLILLIAEEMSEGPLSTQNRSSSGANVGALSACMEFLLQEKMLPKLAQYAEADRPLGVRQHVYLFLIGVLNHLHHSHLHHTPIHKPLQALVVASCNMTASPYESQEMEFLSTLCEKIRQDNTLILLYIQPHALKSDTPAGSRSATPVNNCQISTKISLPPEEGSSTLSSKRDSIPEKTVPKFPLVDALLNLCHSADAQISKLAHEYLIVVAGLRVPMCSSAIAQHTLLPHYVASRLLAATRNIPADTEPQLVEDVNVNDRLSEKKAGDSDDESEDLCDFPGRPQIVEFLRWLIYCDKVVGASDSVLGGSICGTVVEVLLEGEIRPALCDSQDEDLVALYTALLAKIITTIVAPQFSAVVLSWLRGEPLLGIGNGSYRTANIKNKSLRLHRDEVEFTKMLSLLVGNIIIRPGAPPTQPKLMMQQPRCRHYDNVQLQHMH
ncbi:unnamed protein product [Meganyctiphanes norvegica]|uniref:Uncharacterized protein n=1 Tax=Meganyctiphanes norvegica TaxID=48144 RepID=A0AAV2PTB2_MEGNR